jgi:RHS repeat-associated protein
MIFFCYDSFGNISNNKNKIDQPYTYTGREYDRETGLYYYRARYYDASIGRFTAKDPIGFEGGINLYAYVGNNPVKWIDPWGLTKQCPECPPVNNPDWVAYHGGGWGEWLFHCGFDGYHENRAPTPGNPTIECFYDCNGNLVDNNHKFAGCKGTPNQYSSTNIFHFYPDSGGIIKNFGPSFWTSRQHDLVKFEENHWRPFWTNIQQKVF